MLKYLITKLASRLGFVLKKQRSSIHRKRVVSGGGSNFEHALLMEVIHGTDIYIDFPYEKYPEDRQGWGGDSSAFATLIRSYKPRLIIEVGTWKGASAIEMARNIKETGGGSILCVDTWLGALEFWEDQNDPDRFKSLNCKHGYPQVYYTFLANVCHAGMQDTIIPFPIHSSSAALWILRKGIVADMVYVDGSHEEEDVYQDLMDYFEILRDGGVIFGDDWNWTGVRCAVERFSSTYSVKIDHVADKWVIRKANKSIEATA